MDNPIDNPEAKQPVEPKVTLTAGNYELVGISVGCLGDVLTVNRVLGDEEARSTDDLKSIPSTSKSTAYFKPEAKEEYYCRILRTIKEHTYFMECELQREKHSEHSESGPEVFYGTDSCIDSSEIDRPYLPRAPGREDSDSSSGLETDHSRQSVEDSSAYVNHLYRKKPHVFSNLLDIKPEQYADYKRYRLYRLEVAGSFQKFANKEDMNRYLQEIYPDPLHDGHANEVGLNNSGSCYGADYSGSCYDADYSGNEADCSSNEDED